ncbi:MAG: alcohol dehydrogenase catalytic domain-containing protein [Patescibacteria group bacterium]|nr:alcohol dehydrogenase catalytic domain-containing protein [Patescibacteria group bacterium]MDE2015250.1 alcohol dehydrogenase catalytic domain-containing protein [Patescibacteria group bacterium]MDE2227056.1 alcohol dehydrogenase catalytic domain-containing protein [Patescibacteria group bacterium]
MKAAVLEKINSPLVVEDVELGDLSSGQVLVKILVSGICGAQLQEIAGNKGNAKYVPHLLGHEGCGIVEKIGEGVTRVEKGDKVVIHWRKGEGMESDFPEYVFRGKTIRSGKSTTFGEYSIVSENRVTPVPQDTPNDFCALLGCGLSTALGAISTEASMRPGERIMIIGLGGLGACLIKAAKFYRAGKIVGLDIYENKKEVVSGLGGDLFINSAKEDIAEKLGRELGVADVDIIVDTSGHAGMISATIPLLADGGRYIMVGQSKPGDSVEIKMANHLFGKDYGKTIKATQGGGFMPTRDIPIYVKAYREGLLDIDNLITHRTKLNDINKAIELMRAGKANRIIIDL